MSSATNISAAQRDANRQNAAQSTGPRTDPGKARTRLNGLRHGLSGQTVVMPYENLKEYEEFCAEIVANLHPADDAERSLAQTIANESWRLDRARAIEENVFALGLTTTNAETPVETALNQAMTYLDHAREIHLLSLYAGRISRSIDKSKRELQALQAERQRAREAALEEEILLAELAISKGETYTPRDESACPAYPGNRDLETSPLVKNGSGFSTSEIHRIIDRRNRLKEARSLFTTGRNPKAPNRKAA